MLDFLFWYQRNSHITVKKLLDSLRTGNNI